MSQKKSKRLNSKLNNHPADEVKKPADEAGKELQLREQFAALFFAAEKLLPAFLVGKSLANTRNADAKNLELQCQRSLEKILGLKEKWEKDKLEQRGSYPAPSSSASPAVVTEDSERLNHAQNEVLRTLANGCPLANNKVFSAFLSQRRREILESFDGNLPVELKNWVCCWEDNFNEVVGAEYLKWLLDASCYYEKLHGEWQSEMQRQIQSQPARQLGLLSKLRSLRLANSEKKLRNRCSAVKKSNEKILKNLHKKYAQLHYLCAVIGAMFKTVSVNAGGNAKALTKLLALEVEERLQESLWQEIKLREGALSRENALVSQRHERVKTLRKYLANLESKKNKAALDIYSNSQENVTQLIAQATAIRFSHSFAELSAMVQSKRNEISNQKTIIQGLRGQLIQLKDLLEEYADRFFPHGLYYGANAEHWNPNQDWRLPNESASGANRGIGTVSLRELEESQRKGSQGVGALSFGAVGASAKLSRQRLNS